MSHVLKIFICPLNWGLGHATRVVPIIKNYIADGSEVVLGGDGDALAFLRKEFPELRSIVISNSSPRYGKKGMWGWAFFKFVIYFIFNSFQEHFSIERIQKRERFDLIISDNRYGIWSRRCKSILITHQIQPKIPLGLGWMSKLFSFLLIPFDEVWVPTLHNNFSIAGDLAKPFLFREKIKFLPILSRFQKDLPLSEQAIDILLMLSGPEPQRSIFKSEWLEKLGKTDKKVVVLGASPSSEEKKTEKNITYFSHLSTPEIEDLLRQSKLVISRCGYSTVMDLLTTGNEAILIPTAGQWEQIYLKKRLKELQINHLLREDF